MGGTASSEAQKISASGVPIETREQADARESAEANKYEGNVGYFLTILDQEREKLISQRDKESNATDKQAAEKRLTQVILMLDVLNFDLEIVHQQLVKEAQLGILKMMPDQVARYKQLARKSVYGSIPYNDLLRKLGELKPLASDLDRIAAISEIKMMVMKKRNENVTVR